MATAYQNLIKHFKAIRQLEQLNKIECSVDEDELLDSLDRIQQLVLDLVES